MLAVPHGGGVSAEDSRRSALGAEAAGCRLHNVFTHLHPACAQHDQSGGIGSQIAAFSHAAACEKRYFVLHPEIDKGHITVANVAGDGVTHVVHRDVVRSSGSAVFSVDGEPGCITVSCKVV